MTPTTAAFITLILLLVLLAIVTAYGIHAYRKLQREIDRMNTRELDRPPEFPRTPISLTETLMTRHRDEEILRCLDLMPHSRPHSKMAEDFERDLFVTMRIWGVSKVYVVQETTTDGNGIARWDLWFQKDRPEGKECTEHDFQNLLDMSDVEFSRLPYSPNKYVVEEWRDELRRIRSAKKPFPTAPFNSTGTLVPDEDNV